MTTFHKRLFQWKTSFHGRQYFMKDTHIIHREENKDNGCLQQKKDKRWKKSEDFRPKVEGIKRVKEEKTTNKKTNETEPPPCGGVRSARERLSSAAAASFVAWRHCPQPFDVGRANARQQWRNRQHGHAQHQQNKTTIRRVKGPLAHAGMYNTSHNLQHSTSFSYI